VVKVAEAVRAVLAAIGPAWITVTAAAAGVSVALVTVITRLRSLRQLRIRSRERSRPMMADELCKPQAPTDGLMRFITTDP
jgi:hypothetical protein